MTKKSLNYACLSQAIVEGGWPMAIMVRLSAVPTCVHPRPGKDETDAARRHFTTVVFAVCGLKVMRARTISSPYIRSPARTVLAFWCGPDRRSAQAGGSLNIHSSILKLTSRIASCSLWYVSG